MDNFWQKITKPILILAPMENVTDYVFREVITHAAKPDILFTEFTSADGLTSKGKEALIPKLKFSKIQNPIVAQIWGNNPKNLTRSAQLVEKLGFSGIDINMGCPDKTIVRRGECGGLIGDFKTTKEVIKAVQKGTKKLPISIKTRLAQTPEQTKEWVSFLLEHKIAALTIHGRTVKQMSKSVANWEEIAEAVKLKNKISPDTLIIGNGDILSFNEALRMRTDYAVDGVMIGRGIFQNPWVFDKKNPNKSHTKQEYIDLLLKHLKLHDEVYGDTKHFEALKKFFKMYIKDFAGANELRQTLMETKTKEEVEQILSSVQG